MTMKALFMDFKFRIVSIRVFGSENTSSNLEEINLILYFGFLSFFKVVKKKKRK